MHQLEMLHAPGEADDGDGEEDAEGQVCQGDPDAEEYQPDQVHDRGKAAAGHLRSPHFAAKRPEGQHAQLHGLKPKGDADDGQHQDKTCREIFDGYGEASEDKPDEVAEDLHGKRGLESKVGKMGGEFGF